MAAAAGKQDPTQATCPIAALRAISRYATTNTAAMRIQCECLPLLIAASAMGRCGQRTPAARVARVPVRGRCHGPVAASVPLTRLTGSMTVAMR